MLFTNTSLNKQLKGMGQSPTLAINNVSKQLAKEGKRIYRMGLGQSPFPVPESVVNRLKIYAHEKDYLPCEGLSELRSAVARFHRRKDNVNIQEDQVLVGPGSKELMFLLQLCFNGEIILSTPSWVSYLPQAHILGRPVKFIATDANENWKINPEKLEAFLKKQTNIQAPRIVILNYPANPDGCTYSAKSLEQLADVGRRYNLIFLSDEIYGMLHFAGEHISIGQFYPEGTIISSGLSKWCGAGGWRLGTFSFPKELHWLQEAMTAAASETYTSVSAPIQYAAVTAFECDIDIERYLWHVRRILKNLVYTCVDRLRKIKIDVARPDGAFYLFIDCSYYKEGLMAKGITDSADFCNKLLHETGVAILPGSAFNRNEYEFTARLALVNFDGGKTLAKSETIPMHEPLPKNFIATQCTSVLEGIDALCDWLLQYAPA